MHNMSPARLLCLVLTLAACRATGAADKQSSIFYPRPLRETARVNASGSPLGSQLRQLVVQHAQPWLELSEEQLWGLMFGPTIERAWMVWSDGHCPACGKSVPMYNWQMDAMSRPWKTWCPHCDAVFPTNDFAAFYRSGLDKRGIFDPAAADRSLLFNAAHPDPNDPLHRFGVDDGEGFFQDGKRWRFIGAYLIYGQWKQAVLGGINALSEAYVVTGDRAYARKAGILLDRVADLYPSFDFAQQAVIYERRMGSAGYVSVWHDACEETRELAQGYDTIFEAIAEDAELVALLRAKAARHGLENRKESFADIRRNIEDRILRDALSHVAKISSNYPRTPIAVATIKAVLDWPDSRDEVYQIIVDFLRRATAVDGVTGEKGLANYSAFGLQSTAMFLAIWDRAIPGFLEEMLRRHPQLHDMYRFHVDTWCLTQYYPLVGDSGWFAARHDQYQGVRFQRPGRESVYSHKDPLLSPSMFTFLGRMHELTQDPAFIQVLYLANDRAVAGLPHDVFAADPAAFRTRVAQVIAEQGEEPKQESVNKQQWRIALLKSGAGADSRVAWLNYEAGGGHGHLDGMNLGLFAFGLDLMPDFGYPPVQFGGWGSARSRWYHMTAGHNTVVVDGKNQAQAAGTTTLWKDGEVLRAVRASCPAMIGGKQYERTVASVQVGPESFYVLDVFRVVGGKDHAKFMHSHFATLRTEGLKLEPGPDYGHATQMRDFRYDAAATPGWNVTWDVEDRYGYLAGGAKVHLRYTDLTAGAAVAAADAGVIQGGYGSSQETWIPRIMVRRTADQEPLASCFVGVIEPYSKQAAVQAVARLVPAVEGKAMPDGNVALRVDLADGRTDLVVALDAENPLNLRPSRADGSVHVPAWGLVTDAELCLVRLDAAGQVEHVAQCGGTFVEVRGTRFHAGQPANAARAEGCSPWESPAS